MQIAQYIRALIAVLGLAAVIHPVSCHEYVNDTLLHDRVKRSPHTRHFHEGFWYYLKEDNLSSTLEHLSPRQNQNLLRSETQKYNMSDIDCCPSVLEMIEPKGASNKDNEYVVLYQDARFPQRFYEFLCHSSVLNKPCRFMDKKLHNNSRCVQKYSYTYALIKNTGKSKTNFSFPKTDGASWTLDYIRVRSGCSCVVTPTIKKRNKKKHRRKQHEDHR